MPALSTSTIAASDSASKAAAKTSARGADKSADSSPFATLLAATSQQDGSRKPQAVATQAANGDDKPAVKIADARNRTAQTAPQSPARPHGDIVASRDGVKRDKKADSDKDSNDDAVASQAQQAQPPAQTAPAAANAPPVAIANAQAPGATEDDASPDALAALSSSTANSGGMMVQAGNTNNDLAGDEPVNTGPTDPPPVSQPVAGQNGPYSQNPPIAQIAAADGDDSPAIGTPSNLPGVAKTDKSVEQDKTSDSKATADKAAVSNSASNAPIDLQTLSQPLPATADDAKPPVQAIAAALPVGSSPGPVAANGEDAVTAAQWANAAPAQAGKSDTKNPGPSNRSKQSAATSGTPFPAVNLQPPSPAMPTTRVPGKDGADAVQAASTGNRDDKPVHVSAPDAASPPQPEPPAPIPQATPAPLPPQGVAAADFAVTAPAAGGTAVTTALHIAAADTDPTPNFGALAVSIAARSLSGAKQFEIRLDPPELGRVDVRLSIDASGKTQAHMTADQPQTLSLLQKDAPTLTQALRDAGLDVSQSGLNFSLRGQDRQNDGGGDGAGQGRRTNLTATRAIQAAQSPTAISFNGAAADARVDIHV
ncbi:MAG: flagellar hook-length control protein FliK [Rhizomicrobium sp.]